ncbi:MAG: hypothetical protein JWN04_5911 [Myxococcaceae bacterium]|nr:hypothetical protein [Myxococcaceae bacterium]
MECRPLRATFDGMTKHHIALVIGLFVSALALTVPAQADVGIGGGALVGTGVNVGGHADNNPYKLQLGAYGELNLGSFLVGVRGTRSLASNAKCDGNHCRDVRDLRTIGGDLGYLWDLPLVHVGPRLGIGYLKERDGARVGAYFEPGVSADVQLLLFNVGAEVRYRIVAGAHDANGVIAYLRLGIRL